MLIICFFADDSILFCIANLREWRCIQEILAGYEVASGQKINKDKSLIFFSRNTKQEVRDAINQEANVDSVRQFERYLGLPALIGRSRISSFNSIKGRIWSKLNGWKEKLLTYAGKEILLKSVIQAIPNYTMSVFWLPKTLIKEINSMISKFWWGFKENFNKISWVSWKHLGRKKDIGGLGYRELDCFNMAMLAKQCWRLLKHPDSLAARVMRDKYYSGVDFMGSNLEVYGMLNLCWRKELCGGWGMERRLKYGKIGGFLRLSLTKFRILFKFFLEKPRLQILLM